MIDERLLIQKLESIKNKLDEAMRVPSPPFPYKVLSPDNACCLIDNIIEYIKRTSEEGEKR